MTMHHMGGVSSQSFCLPLVSLDTTYNEELEDEENVPKRDNEKEGLLNLFVSYKTEVSHSSTEQQRNRHSSEMIGLSVSILRMCSLKVL